MKIEIRPLFFNFATESFQQHGGYMDNLIKDSLDDYEKTLYQRLNELHVGIKYFLSTLEHDRKKLLLLRQIESKELEIDTSIKQDLTQIFLNVFKHYSSIHYTEISFRLMATLVFELLILAEEGKFERSNSEIKAIVNGREVRWEEIKHWKSIRAAHVLQELVDLGQEVYLNQYVLPHQNFYQLTEDELIQGATESKLALGTNKILEIYDKHLNEIDDMWERFVQRTPKDAPFKERHVIIEVKGITPAMVSNIDQESGMSLEGSYSLHPEHYVFSQTDNMQFEMLDPNTHKLPGDINPNATKDIFVP